MHFLGVFPDLGPEINAIAQQMLRNRGHTFYPLMGEVTERQLMEACIPANNFDGIIILSHGGPEGILIKPDRRDFDASDAGPVWLPIRAVVAAVQAAATMELCVLASCQGRVLAEELYWRANLRVVYSEGDLLVPNAYTMAGTFLQRLATGTMQDALAIADTLNMKWYPPRSQDGNREITDALQAAVQMLAARIDRMEARNDERMDHVEERQKRIEDKVDGLTNSAVIMTPRRRGVWILGAILYAAPFFLSDALRMAGVRVEWTPYVLVTALCLAMATLLLLAGFGRLPAPS